MSKHLSDISVQSITRRISYLVRSCFTHTAGGGEGGGEPSAFVVSSPQTAKHRFDSRGIENSPPTICIPFSILEKYLPAEARGYVTERFIGMAIKLPKDLVLERIATGTFRITLGELYQFVKKPSALVPASEHLQLEIPLKEILSLIDPESLPRKKPKKRIIPPLDIPAPFQLPSKTKQIPNTAPDAAHHPLTTKPLNGKSSIAGVETGSIWARQTQEENHYPASDLAIPAPHRAQTNTQLPTPESSDIRPTNFETLPESTTIVAPAAPELTTEPPDQLGGDPDGYTVFRLQDLWETWPAIIKTEAMLAHKEALVYIPDAFLRVELRKGRLLCTADILKSWIRDPKARRAMPNSTQLTLELPLKVVVPAFIQKTGQIRQPAKSFELGPAWRAPAHSTPPVPELKPETVIRQTSVGFEQPAVVRISTNPQPEATPTIPVPQPAVRKPDPAGLVAQALTLPGVAGAIIALPNGVIAAQRLPKDLNPDAVAEFVHRAMDQINQCATVLRQGYTTRLSFTVGEISWAIFKRGAICFAAMSKPNQMLPEESLGLLAAELESTRQPKQQPWQS